MIFVISIKLINVKKHLDGHIILALEISKNFQI